MSKKQSMEEIYHENRYWVYGSFLRKTGAVEIAEIIGISPSLVRMRLSRITEKLRKQMKKEMGKGGEICGAKDHESLSKKNR